ncbi:MAG: hypothetical protein CL670_16045 [Balneola sp.]|jgi:hypothetical protein|nr:hypothetical protein [Balneola sp.]MBE80672.1 hypothetical protein [Balneola sp.]MBE80673.1 hypothetical protein [Balneola sp.]|tara:strand:- start:195 stop:380 length:186 start_codon:yes stop_codon:yes gene_type:complete
MKSLKSLFALIAIVSLSFGCASVTDASLSDELASEPTIETTSDNGVFSGGNDVKPIVEKPW